MKIYTCGICKNGLPLRFITKISGNYCMCDRCLVEYEYAHKFVEKLYSEDELVNDKSDSENKPKLEA